MVMECSAQLNLCQVDWNWQRRVVFWPEYNRSRGTCATAGMHAAITKHNAPEKVLPLLLAHGPWRPHCALQFICHPDFFAVWYAQACVSYSCWASRDDAAIAAMCLPNEWITEFYGDAKSLTHTAQYYTAQYYCTTLWGIQNDHCWFFPFSYIYFCVTTSKSITTIFHFFIPSL